jgi:hypothetical protein
VAEALRSEKSKLILLICTVFGPENGKTHIWLPSILATGADDATVVPPTPFE